MNNFTPPPQDKNSNLNKKFNLPVGFKAFLLVEGIGGVALALWIVVSGINPLEVAEKQWNQYMLEGQEKAAFHYLCSKGRKDFCSGDSSNRGFLGFVR